MAIFITSITKGVISFLSAPCMVYLLQYKQQYSLPMSLLRRPPLMLLSVETLSVCHEAVFAGGQTIRVFSVAELKWIVHGERERGKKEGARSATEGPMKRREKGEKINHDGRPSYQPILRVRR